MAIFWRCTILWSLDITPPRSGATKVRLALGHDLYTLQELLAKPGYGNFVAALKALGHELGFKLTTGYALINEYKISLGLKAKSDPPKTEAAKQSFVFSRPEKTNEEGRGKNFTIVSDPTLGLQLAAPPILPEIEAAEAKKKIEVQIPVTRIDDWDDAILVLQAVQASKDIPNPSWSSRRSSH